MRVCVCVCVCVCSTPSAREEEKKIWQLQFTHHMDFQATPILFEY